MSSVIDHILDCAAFTPAPPVKPAIPKPRKITLTVADQRALWSACEQQWEYQRKRFWRVSLPSQEWEDIRSKAFDRVFRKANLWNPAKGDLLAWSNTVIRRAMMNEFRNSLPSIPSHEARTDIQHARPFRQTLVRNQWGDERIVIEPDQPHQSSRVTMQEVQDFRCTLKPKERKVVDLLLAGRSVRDVQHRMGLLTWDHAKQVARRIGELWKAQGERPQPYVEERMPAALVVSVERARVVRGAGSKRRMKLPRRAWLKRMRERLNAKEWAHLRTLWPDLPTFERRFVP